MLIFNRFSKCTKDYLQYSSAISLLSVLLLILVDILPRLRKADASWILDDSSFLHELLIIGIGCSKVSSTLVVLLVSRMVSTAQGRQ